MNVRLGKAEVRFRVKENEFEALVEKGNLEEEVVFAKGEKLSYKVVVCAREDMGVGFKADELKLEISDRLLAEGKAKITSKDGLSQEIITDGGSRLKCTFQVDLFK
jgi:hypothetical protein